MAFCAFKLQGRLGLSLCSSTPTFIPIRPGARLKTDSRTSTPSSSLPLSHLPAPSSSVCRLGDSQPTMPSAIKSTFWSMNIIYIISLLFISLNLSYNDEFLLFDSPLMGLPLPGHWSVSSTWRIFLVSTTSSMSLSACVSFTNIADQPNKII